MKKKKFNLLLNIATLCLCITAIAFGVYSAKTASLNITGTVGFQAHNCDVYVYGTVAGGTQTGGDAKFGAENSYINVHDTTKNSWTLGTLMFDDLGDVPEGKNAKDIVITLKMFNESKFDVRAKFNTNFLTANYSGKVKATANPTTMVLPANKTLIDAQTMTITLSLESTSDFTGTAFSGETLVSFEKKDENSTSPFFIGETGTSLEGKFCMNIGTMPKNQRPSTATDNTPVVWYAYAYSTDKGNTWQTLANKKYTSVEDVNTTYYYRFIMQYVISNLGEMWDNDDITQCTGFTYLTGGDNGFLKDISMSDTASRQFAEEFTKGYDMNTKTYTTRFYLLNEDELKLLAGENDLSSTTAKNKLMAFSMSKPDGDYSPMIGTTGVPWICEQTSSSISTINYIENNGNKTHTARGVASKTGIRPAFELNHSQTIYA